MKGCNNENHNSVLKSIEAVSEVELERVCNLFRVLSEPSRFKIVVALSSGELCVHHILQAVGGTQSGVSHQLRVLKDNGIVKARRDGQNILYSIADGHIFEIVATAKAHTHCQEE